MQKWIKSFCLLASLLVCLLLNSQTSFAQLNATKKQIRSQTNQIQPPPKLSPHKTATTEKNPSNQPEDNTQYNLIPESGMLALIALGCVMVFGRSTWIKRNKKQ